MEINTMSSVAATPRVAVKGCEHFLATAHCTPHISLLIRADFMELNILFPIMEFDKRGITFYDGTAPTAASLIKLSDDIEYIGRWYGDKEYPTNHGWEYRIKGAQVVLYR